VSTNSINTLSNSYAQSIFNNALQGTASSTSQSGGVGSTQQSDNSQLSPFAQLLTVLQQLQQNNPTQYQQVTQQIATNLQSAAQTATSQGNTTAATQLTQLATDFTNASTSGQLPNIQDLAQAIGGQHHHHHHHSGGSTQSSGTDSASDSTSATDGTSASQLFSAFQSNASQNAALNPLSIIENTLSSAGIGN
jgi:hypothetical protein